jgi:hypothetical protein
MRDLVFAYQTHRAQCIQLQAEPSCRSDVSVTELDWVEEGWEVEYIAPDYGRLGIWYTMVSIKPTCAFVIHQSCWSLLQTHFAVEEINVDRLFEVCRDIPPSGRQEFYSNNGEILIL